MKIIIPLKISANMDGSVNSVEIDDQSRYVKDTFYRATADSARRAVLDCSPYPCLKIKQLNLKASFLTLIPHLYIGIRYFLLACHNHAL